MNMESITTLTLTAKEEISTILDVWHIHALAAVQRINRELAKHKGLPEAFCKHEIEHYDRHSHCFLGYAPVLPRDGSGSIVRQKGGDDWQLVLEVVERNEDDDGEEFGERSRCHGKVEGYIPLSDCIPDLRASALPELPFLLMQLGGESGGYLSDLGCWPLPENVERLASLPDSDEVLNVLATMKRKAA
jgi:hypothetical protein